MTDNTCTYCVLEMCFQCSIPDEEADECCCKGTYGRLSLGSMFVDSTPLKHKSGKQMPTGTGQKVGRPTLNASEMKNPVAAGRARAEDLAPIPEGYICEWALLDYAGGGIEPVIGCAGNTATDRHHGPSKATLDNTVGINLHRICATCHVRWHQLNDRYYGEERPIDNLEWLPLPQYVSTPHDRISRAQPTDVALNEIWWKTKLTDRGGYRSWQQKTQVDSTSNNSEQPILNQKSPQ